MGIGEHLQLRAGPAAGAEVVAGSMARAGGCRPVIPILIGSGWAAAVWLEVTAVGGGRPPLASGPASLWTAGWLFLAGWQVMTAAMMLPGAAGAICRFAAASRIGGGPHRAVPLFVLVFFAAWSLFGALAFLGFFLLQRLAQRGGWLGSHSAVVSVAILVLAALYQMTPIKRSFLESCRGSRASGGPLPRSGARAGLAHAGRCLGSCWALMLIMFVPAGHLPWTIILTAVVAAEKALPGARRLPVAVGCLLLGVAVWSSMGFAAASPGVPAGGDGHGILLFRCSFTS